MSEFRIPKYLKVNVHQLSNSYPLVICYIAMGLWKMNIEIVDLPIQHGGPFHSYVNVYQRVTPCKSHEITMKSHENHHKTS